jgi:hypothetical protein
MNRMSRETAHDLPALRDAVAFARAAAVQLGQDVFVQRLAREPFPYLVRLDDAAPRGRRNCYRLRPDGQAVPFLGNPPYHTEG